MRIVNTAQFLPDALNGNQPEILFSNDHRPDGDVFPWSDAAIGTVNVARLASDHVEISVKMQDDNSDYDWHVTDGIISQYVTVADFTDGAGAAGTFTTTSSIPLGATVDYAFVKNVTAWDDDTTAVITIGDGTDVDRYNTGTPSVAATITYLSVGAPSGTAYHAAAKTVVVTVTGGSDFTAFVTAATPALAFGVHYHM